jgi:hypothetical protein
MNTSITYKGTIQFRRGRNNQKRIKAEEPPTPPSSIPTGRVPRVARLMALALRFEKLIREGAISDQADLARLGHVTRARATQIMSLLQLAPDIQESILFLPLVETGRDPIRERQFRPIAAVLDWRKQRKMWQDVWGTLKTLHKSQPVK